jgi:succinyl-CoA synthetase beta subunit
MKIHEYQAKELLAGYGAAIPRHIIVRSVEEAEKAWDTLGGPVVLKAQVHAGGRGQGQLVGYADKLGGVKFVPSREKLRPLVEAMLKHPLKTKQTGPEGQKVSTLMVQADAEPDREFYVGMVLDRALGVPVIMASAEGGMDIEEVAVKHPEKILRVPVDPCLGLHPYQARKLAFDLGFKGEQIDQAVKMFLALSKAYLDKDASLAEINPLAITKKGHIVALDAKFTFDDNALYRHPEIAALRDEAEEDPAELRASKSDLSFISLTGTIGCLVNGAGLAMATMDIVAHHGGFPANFLDVGGGADVKKVTEAFRIILADSRVKAVLVNIFGGIMQCDTIATAILAAYKEVGFHVPLVVRLEGTNVEIARKMLAESGVDIISANGLTEAAEKVVAASKK